MKKIVAGLKAGVNRKKTAYTLDQIDLGNKTNELDVLSSRSLRKSLFFKGKSRHNKKIIAYNATTPNWLHRVRSGENLRSVSIMIGYDIVPIKICIMVEYLKKIIPNQFFVPRKKTHCTMLSQRELTKEKKKYEKINHVFDNCIIALKPRRIILTAALDIILEWTTDGNTISDFRAHFKGGYNSIPKMTHTTLMYCWDRPQILHHWEEVFIWLAWINQGLPADWCYFSNLRLVSNYVEASPQAIGHLEEQLERAAVE